MNLFFKNKKKPAMDAMQAFIDDYKKVVRKHGYDMESVGWITAHDGSSFPTERLRQINKELSEFLAKRKAKLNFNFTIVKLEKNAKQPDKP